MLQTFARTAARTSVMGARRFVSTGSEAAAGNKFQQTREAVKQHAAETTDLWRKISFYVCIPGIIVGSIYVWNVEQEHASHIEHEIEENGGEPPEKTVYPYMNIRTKPFPWGMQALMFNPKVNIPAEEA